MSSEIDNNFVYIQRLIPPICVNAAIGVSPSLPPIEGSIVRDDSTPGLLYVGTGLHYEVLAAGDVVGPGLANNNDLVAFDGLTGKLVKDSGIPYTDVVKASSTAVSGHLPQYNGTGGRIVNDSGILASNVVQGPASSGNANVVTYNGTTGKLIADSGVSFTNMVQKTTTSVLNNLVAYSDTTGNNIKDSGVLSTNVVTNAGTGTSGNLASFSSSKVIQDSAVSMASTTVAGIVFTGSGANPGLTGSLNLQRTTIGAIGMTKFFLDFSQNITTTAIGSTWTCPAATVPALYRPIGNVYTPCVLINGAGNQRGVAKIVYDGSIIIYNEAVTAGSTTFSTVSLVYS